MSEKTTKSVAELNIPVPWGHIAAKIWGQTSKPLVLMVHGRMDNAGSFDTLIPLLPNEFCYVCIDLPGHGKSTYFPPHLPIYSLNYVLSCRIVHKYFEERELFWIGHSYGAQLGVLYSRMYPHLVRKFVMLEGIHLFPISPKDFMTYLLKTFEDYFSINDKITNENQRKYTYKEAFEKLKYSRYIGCITDEATEGLLERAVKKVGEGKYVFTLDPRMKNYVDPLHDFHFAVESLENDPVECPTLMLLADLNRPSTNFFKPVMDFYKTREHFRVIELEGNHDIHSVRPEVVAPYISDFLRLKDPFPKGKIKRLTSDIIKFCRFMVK